MRVLVASTEGAGHFGPLVPFLEALGRREDEVVVVVPPALAASAEASRWPLLVGADPPAADVAAIRRRVATASREEAAVLVNRELFGRLSTAAMLPTLEAECLRRRPDLVLREPCEFASAVVADELGIPHAQVAISLAHVEAASLALAGQALDGYARGIADRVRATPYLTRFPASLDPSPFATTRRYREPDRVRREPLPDWWSGRAGPLVYVTFGTVAGARPIGAAAFRAALAAVRDLDARVLLTVGRAFDASTFGSLPPNLHVEPWVPQADVLADAAVVVCHGGSGTTFGALAAGVPLVVVPLFADQPANGRRVQTAGAGIVVEPRADAREDPAVDVASLRSAIDTVLGDRSYRVAAARVAREVRAAPAVDEVLAAVATGSGGSRPARR